MNKITGFSVLTTGEGERVTLSYSVLDADGNIVSTNNRKNYVVLDEDVLTAIAAIRKFIQIESERMILRNTSGINAT